MSSRFSYGADRSFHPLLDSRFAMSGQQQYNPVPLQEHRDETPYDAPLAPGDHLAHFQNPETEPLGPHDDDLGMASMRPRFLGTALYDEGPRPRESYADSQNSFPMSEDYQSSVHGLAPGGQRDTAFYSLNYRDDPHGSDFAGSQADLNLGKSPSQASPYLSEKRATYATPRARSRRRALIIGGLVAAAIIAVAVVVAVYFAIIKPHNKDSDVSGGSSSGSHQGGSTATTAPPTSGTGKPTQNLAVTGGDGSKVTMDDGSTFTYQNSFGGYWYWDPKDPFNNGARAQSWSPALNETFNYGVDRIRG